MHNAHSITFVEYLYHRLEYMDGKLRLQSIGSRDHGVAHTLGQTLYRSTKTIIIKFASNLPAVAFNVCTCCRWSWSQNRRSFLSIYSILCLLYPVCQNILYVLSVVLLNMRKLLENTFCPSPKSMADWEPFECSWLDFVLWGIESLEFHLQAYPTTPLGPRMCLQIPGLTQSVHSLHISSSLGSSVPANTGSVLD